MKPNLICYLRLSREDQWEGESISIQNQRALLHDYLKREQLYQHYQILEMTDDGFSGTGSKRPGFDRVLQLIEGGRVSCLLVKDLSRLSRNHIQLGYLTEQLLPACSVRLIAVEDGYDSRVGEMDLKFSLQSLLNEWYSRDLSMKIKASKQTLAAKGRLASGACPYGYCKSLSPDRCYEVDEPAAQVVRQIFSMAQQGNKKKDIADFLNQNGVPTPAVYKRKKKSGCGQEVLSQGPVWDSSKVSRIIRDIRYTGTLITGRYASMGFGTGKTVTKSSDQWFLFEHHHVALVEQDCFLAINGTKQAVPRQKTSPHPFFRRIYCIHCGNILYHKGDKLCCHNHCFQSCLNDKDVTKVITHLIRLVNPGLFQEIIEIKKSNKSFSCLINSILFRIKVLDINKVEVIWSHIL